MDFNKVKKAIEAAEAKAKDLGAAVTIAIVDEYGDIVAVSRMENAIKISPKFALAKAKTAGSIGLATSDIAQYAVEGKPYFGIDSLFGGELTTIAGGIPIKINEKLAGGIGVGGSTDINQDVACAEAALAELI